MTTPHELAQLEAAYGESDTALEQFAVLTAAPVSRPCPSCFGPAVQGQFAVGRGFDVEHEVTRIFCYYCRLDLNTCDTHGNSVVSWGMTMYVADDDQFRRPDDVD